MRQRKECANAGGGRDCSRRRLHSSFSTPRISSSRNSMNLRSRNQASASVGHAPRTQRARCKRSGHALRVVQLYRLAAILRQQHPVARRDACSGNAAAACISLASPLTPPARPPRPDTQRNACVMRPCMRAACDSACIGACVAGVVHGKGSATLSGACARTHGQQRAVLVSPPRAHRHHAPLIHLRQAEARAGVSAAQGGPT